MIDQSNRAGKLNINGSKNPDGGRILLPVSPSSIMITKRQNHSKRIREITQNQKRMHRQTIPNKIPVTASAATVISRRSPLSYMTTGKNIK